MNRYIEEDRRITWEAYKRHKKAKRKRIIREIIGWIAVCILWAWLGWTMSGMF